MIYVRPEGKSKPLLRGAQINWCSTNFFIWTVTPSSFKGLMDQFFTGIDDSFSGYWSHKYAGCAPALLTKGAVFPTSTECL